MQKKILTGIILVCLLGIIALIFIFLKKGSETLENTVYEAVPTNSAVVLEINNLKAFKAFTNSNNEAWNAISAFTSIQDYNNLITDIDSTLAEDASFMSLAENNFVITIQQIGKNRLEYLFLVPLKTESQIATASNFVRKYFKDDSVSSYDYDKKSTVYNFLNTKTNTQIASYSIAKQTLIISPSRILVENALKSIYSEHNLMTDPNFAKVKKNAKSKVQANLFINFDQIANIAYLFADNSLKKGLLKNASLASWGEFDINIGPDAVTLNGFTSIKENTDYFSIFQKQTPVDFELKEILPAGTSSFIAMGISNKELFISNYEMYLKKTNRFNRQESRLKKINEALTAPNIAKVDIKNTIYSLLDNEVAMVYANINGLNIYENTYAVLKVQSQTQAKEQLIGLVDNYCEKNKKSLNDYKSVYKLDNKISYDIYNLPAGNIPQALWGNSFENTTAKYFAFIENYVVFGNSTSSLSKFIHSYELQKTLENDPMFEKYKESILSTYNWHLFSNVSKSYAIYPKYLDDNLKETLENNEKELRKFECFSLQVQSHTETLYNHFYIKYNPVNKDKPHTVWESYLDTVVTTKPGLVEVQYFNGNEKITERAILVQDAKNMLYLVNHAGKIQWKKQLESEIISNFTTIDFYRNQKYQYVFNTANKLYIIDRLGNFVEQYPITFESEATSAIGVFDYDNSRDYRFLVPCKNHKVYLYDKEGKKIKGWQFTKTESDVTQAPQHFRIGIKDYIVFADKLNIYIVNRRGEDRINVKEQIEKSPNNTFTLDNTNPNNPKLITTNIEGKVKTIHFDGDVTTETIKAFPKEHFFEYRDIDNDGKNDYLFLYNNILEGISQNKEEIFSYKFENNITHTPSLYSFSRNTYKIGVVDDKVNKIYLIDGKGNLHNGFPLQGKTLFSIGHIYESTNTFNLIIGGDENFLYNYEVK